MPGRKYVSDFSVGIGPINLNGALYGLRKGGSGEVNKFVGVCPDCETPTKPSQRYVCPTDPTHSHPLAELDRAKEVGGELVRVSVEEIAAARESKLPKNVFNATVVTTADVENVTWHADHSYVFVPTRMDEYYGLATRLVAESGKSFVAMANVKNNEGFYKLAVWQNYLVLQKLHWPEECETFGAVEPDCDQNVFDAAMNMLDKMERPFDADQFRSTVKQQLEALESGLWDAGWTDAPVVLPAENPDLLSVLAAFEA